MDIDKFLECLNSKNYDTETALSIISEYCKLHNKDLDKITKLLPFLASNQMALIQCLQIALPSIISKYKVSSVRDKHGNIIFYFI